MYKEMAVDTTITENNDLSQQRDYLRIRMSEVNSAQNQALRNNFYMDDDTRPRTPKELVERVLAGRYVLPDEEQSSREYYKSPFCQMIWRDPKHPADKEGYAAALDVQRKTHQKTLDAAIIFTPEEGLKAIQAYEAMKPEDFTAH